jgi:FkbM family methyltransferase
MQNLLFKQLNILLAIKILTLKFLKKILLKQSQLYYSQTGEDIILKNLINKSNGIYVDVGCHKPIEKSNTFLFYLNGWSGITIDAEESHIKEFKKIRPKDKSFNYAISNKNKEETFYKFKQNAVSTLSKKNISEWKSKWDIETEIKVKTEKLEDILKINNFPSFFDLLCIDVEGLEYEVLDSLNLNKYTPNFIIVEIHSLNLMDIKENEIVNYLLNFNYKLIGYVTMNAYFQKI